jgi:hypothetical protein
MAQPGGNSSGPSAPSGGSSGGKGGSSGDKSGSSSSSKGSRSSSNGATNSKTSSSGKRDPIEALANVVPSHHAHHGMSGEYSTKGKFTNMPDGNSAFGD